MRAPALSPASSRWFYFERVAAEGSQRCLEWHREAWKCRVPRAPGAENASEGLQEAKGAVSGGTCLEEEMAPRLDHVGVLTPPGIQDGASPDAAKHHPNRSIPGSGGAAGAAHRRPGEQTGPGYPAQLPSHLSPLPFQTRSSRHSQGSQPGLADQAKLSFASAESLETMSEAELPLGFNRMNRFRQSLPLSRSTSQTKLRSPGSPGARHPAGRVPRTCLATNRHRGPRRPADAGVCRVRGGWFVSAQITPGGAGDTECCAAFGLAAPG